MLSPAEHLPIIWLCGAPASGKSVTAWQLFSDLDDEQVGYVDIDQLKMLFGGADLPGAATQLAADNLAELARIHQRAGSRALIVSGVLEPDERPVFAAAARDAADITWALLDAPAETLHRRMAERSWPDELLDAACAEAEAWRTAAGLAAVIDTSKASVVEAARSVTDMMTLRPARDAQALPPAWPGALICLYGARAVGKSRLSWELFMRRAGSAPTGYLDAQQISFVHADDELTDRLQLAAITALAGHFAAAGATLTIVNGALGAGVRAQLHGLGAQLVRVDADAERVEANIAARRGGDEARLTGDDLLGTTPEHQAAVLAESLEQAQLLAAEGGRTHVLSTSDRLVGESVDELAGLVDMTRRDPIDARVHANPPSEGVDYGRCCVIITGSSAAGKSTIARALAERLERSAVLNGDEVHWMIVGGRVWPLGEPKQEAARQTRLGNRNLCALAANCAEAGFTPVIDWIIPDAEQLDAFIQQLFPLAVWLIVLDPGDAACRQRNLQRDDQFAFDGYDQLVGGMRRAFGPRAWWVDSSEQTADETLETICARAGLGR